MWGALPHISPLRLKRVPVGHLSGCKTTDSGFNEVGLSKVMFL